MHYREHRPGPPLDAFVECVWFLSASPAPSQGFGGAQRILPDGCAELVLHFLDRFEAAAHGRAPERQPPALVVGVLTSPLALVPAAHVDTMGVRFRPGGAYPFFPHPLSALTDRSVALEDLWSRAAAHRLWETLAAAHDDVTRLAVVSRALHGRLAHVEPDAVTMSAVNTLVATAGRARIGRLAARAGVTGRLLQRRFADRVGVSPKMLARILRFQRTLLARGASGEAPDWVRVAMECGYTDQSHLIHDYGDFAGETPASLRAAEGELSAYFTAPHRLAALFGARR
jgi:AraC-like DNA-binding protein